MDIVVMAANEELLQGLVAEITGTISNACIETFIDPLLALQYLHNHPTDLVFTKTEMKYLSVTEFINTARRFCPAADISVIAADSKYERQFIASGADRLLVEPLTEEMLTYIITQKH